MIEYTCCHIFIQASEGFLWVLDINISNNLESISGLMSSETLQDLRMLSKPVKIPQILISSSNSKEALAFKFITFTRQP